MTVEKLTTTDAFVVFDLDGADHALGVVRMAPKVLVDGATWLARSQTYQFAVFGCRAGGASAAINAKGEAAPAAVGAFVAEVRPWAEQRRLVIDPGKGTSAEALGALRDVDPRGPEHWDRAPELIAAGLRAAASAGSGGSLDGRRVAIEGFERGGSVTARTLADAGATIVAISTATGTARSDAGLDPVQLEQAWTEHGASLVGALAGDDDALPAAAVLEVPADVLLVGSKAGVIGHAEAATVGAPLIVPNGAVPLTAKALAVLGRRDVVVLPDFVTTAGATLATFPFEPSDGSSSGDPAHTIGELVAELLEGPEPPFLAACRRAEAFLSTWREALPFGRPLA